jgi:hypothetical protein
MIWVQGFAEGLGEGYDGRNSSGIPYMSPRLRLTHYCNACQGTLQLGLYPLARFSNPTMSGCMVDAPC